MIFKKFVIIIFLFYSEISNAKMLINNIIVKVDNKIITNFDLKNKILTTFFI